MRSIRDYKRVHIIFILVLVFCFSFMYIMQVAMAETGTSSSTATSQEVMVAGVDYVDEKVGQLNTVIDALKAENEKQKATIDELTDSLTLLTAKLDELSQKSDSLNTTVEGQAKSLQYEVIELKAGQVLTAGASAEIIVRGGKATAIASENGGLSDITSGTGVDIMDGKEIPLNHLLLVSRDDGRGLKATTKAYILFKGTCTIK